MAVKGLVCGGEQLGGERLPRKDRRVLVLQVGVLDNRLPAAESTPEEQVQAFLTQLDTTLDGSWEQTTTEDGLEYKHTSGVLRVVRYAPDEVDFALCVTLDPDVYGGLDTLSNVVIGPDGTIYTPGGEYGTF